MNRIKSVLWNNSINKTLLISIISCVIFISVYIINIYREELFGVIPGYGPHNFGFNILFYIPLNVLSLTLSIYAIFQAIRKWRVWNEITKKTLILFLSSPTIFFWIILIISFINNYV